MVRANKGRAHYPPRNYQSQRIGTIVGSDRFLWRRVGSDLALYRGNSKKPLLLVVPDAKWPGMFRVRLSSGSLTDFGNLTRAKDAGLAIALRDLNCEAQEKPSEGTHVHARPRLGIPPSDRARVPAASKKLAVGRRH